MSKIVTISFDVPVERTGLFIDLLMDEGIQARVTYGQQVEVKKNGVRRHVDRTQSTGERLYALLLEDQGTTINLAEKHLVSLGYNRSSTSPALSRLKAHGYAERRDGLWYRTKKAFKAEDMKSPRPAGKETKKK